MPALRKIRGLRKPLPVEAVLNDTDVGASLADGLENALDILDAQAGETAELKSALDAKAAEAKRAAAAAALAKSEAAQAEELAAAASRSNQRTMRYAKAGGIGGLIGHFTGLGTWKGAGAALALAWFTDTEG